MQTGTRELAEGYTVLPSQPGARPRHAGGQLGQTPQSGPEVLASPTAWFPPALGPGRALSRELLPGYRGAAQTSLV